MFDFAWLLAKTFERSEMKHPDHKCAICRQGTEFSACAAKRNAWAVKIWRLEDFHESDQFY